VSSRKFLAALILGCALLPSAAIADDKVPEWLIGTWTPVSDEDGTPPDFADFTADWKYINHGFDCSVRSELPFHIRDGDIYVTIEVPEKGPIAIVFRPRNNGQQLTYTSPRTRNNAVLQKTAKKCE